MPPKDEHINLEHHEKQFDSPFFSTIGLLDFLKSHDLVRAGTEVLDIASGSGANIYHLAKAFPETTFLGVDYQIKAVELGRKLLGERGLANAGVELGDWFDLPAEYRGRFDGVLNVHSLCCFKHLEEAVAPLIDLRPRWLAFNSLFYEGPLDVLIHIRDHENPALTDDIHDADFNTFSLPRFRDYLARSGYRSFRFQRFRIPLPLPRPADGGRGTYTVRTEFDERTQFSGPVHLPWYFVVATT